MHAPTSTSTPMHPRAALRVALRALGDRGISPTARSVYCALWSFADPRGRAWPAQETLARLTGRCVRTVRTAVGELEKAKVIARDVPTLADRRRCRRTTAYLVLALVLTTSPGSARSDAPTPDPTGDAPEATTEAPTASGGDEGQAQPVEPEAPALAWEVGDLVVPLDLLGADDLPPPVEPRPVAPRLAAAAAATTGNRRPLTTGNGDRQKTQGVKTPPRPPPANPDLRAVLARCAALAGTPPVVRRGAG